jgi:hypothetical protein
MWHSSWNTVRSAFSLSLSGSTSHSNFGAHRCLQHFFIMSFNLLFEVTGALQPFCYQPERAILSENLG